jgi:hypothetical protein
VVNEKAGVHPMGEDAGEQPHTPSRAYPEDFWLVEHESGPGFNPFLVIILIKLNLKTFTKNTVRMGEVKKEGTLLLLKGMI